MRTEEWIRRVSWPIVSSCPHIANACVYARKCGEMVNCPYPVSLECKETRFAHKGLQVGTCKVVGQVAHCPQIHVLRDSRRSFQDLQDCNAFFKTWRRDIHQSVQATCSEWSSHEERIVGVKHGRHEHMISLLGTWPKNRRVDAFWVIRGRQDDNPLATMIHLQQQLRDELFKIERSIVSASWSDV